MEVKANLNQTWIKLQLNLKLRSTMLKIREKTEN